MNAVSNNFETDFVQGGLFNDVDARIDTIEYCIWDYDGKSVRTLAVKADLTILLDGGQPGDQVTQHWSAGSADAFAPSEDGGFCLPTGTATGLSKGSNWDLFLNSCAKSGGLTGDKLNGEKGIRALQGAEMHLVRVAPPKRENLPSQQPTQAGGAKKNNDVLVCSHVIKWPWDTKGATTRGRAAARPAAGTSAAGSGAARPAPAAAPATGVAAPVSAGPAAETGVTPETETLAINAINTVLAANNNEMAKDALISSCLRAMMKTPSAQRNQALDLIKDEGWLTAVSDSQGWVYGAGVLLKA